MSDSGGGEFVGVLVIIVAIMLAMRFTCAAIQTLDAGTEYLKIKIEQERGPE